MSNASPNHTNPDHTNPGPTGRPQSVPEAPGPTLHTRGPRRAPRYLVFLVCGVLAGVVAALALTFSRPATPDYGYAAVFGYLALICGLVGGLAGGLVAVLFDRRRR